MIENITYYTNSSKEKTFFTIDLVMPENRIETRLSRSTNTLIAHNSKNIAKQNWLRSDKSKNGLHIIPVSQENKATSTKI